MKNVMILAVMAVFAASNLVVAAEMNHNTNNVVVSKAKKSKKKTKKAKGKKAKKAMKAEGAPAEGGAAPAAPTQ